MEYKKLTEKIIECAYIVEDTVILELKSVKTIAKAHEVQLFNYLTATRKPIGLLINFSPHTVDIKRKHLSTPSL